MCLLRNLLPVCMCMAGPGSARMWTPLCRAADLPREQRSTLGAISLPVAAGATSRGEKPRGARPQPRPRAGAGCWGDSNGGIAVRYYLWNQSWSHSGRDPGGTWGGTPGICKGRNYLGTCGRTLRRNQRDPRDPQSPIPDCAPHGGDCYADLPDLPPGGHHLPHPQVRGVASFVIYINSYSCDWNVQVTEPI